MALNERYVSLRLSQGVDTETDEKTVEPGQPTDLENAVFSKRVTVIKRPGTERLTRTRIGQMYSAISGALGAASRDDDLDLVALSTTDEILSYDDSAEAWVKGGDWVHLRQRMTSLPRRSTQTWDQTTCSTGSVRLVAFESLQGGIFAQMFNQNGKSYGPEFRVSDVLGSKARAITVGGQFQVYFVSGTTPNSLYVGIINPENPSSNGVSLVKLHSSLYTAGPYYDVAPIGSTAQDALLAVNQSGSIYAAVIAPNGATNLSTSGTLGQNVNGLELAPAVAVSPDGTRAVIAYRAAWPVNSTSGTQAWVLNAVDLSTYSSSSAYQSYLVDSDPTVQGSNQLNHITAGFVSASLPTQGDYQFYVAAEVKATPATNRYLRRSQCLVSALTASLSGNLVRHTILGSTMFNINSRPYVWGMRNSNLQSTDFLIRVDDGLTVARSRYGLARADVSGVLGNVDTVGNTFYRAAGIRDSLPINGTNLGSASFSDRYGVLLQTEYAPAHSWKPVDVDGVLHMGGGWPGIYDGTQVVELGFAVDCEDGTVSPGSGSTGGGSDPWGISAASVLGTASIIWATVPEWFDANGNRYLGGFSDFITGTMSGSAAALHSQNSASLTIPTISHTMKDGTRAPNLRFAVYRSAPNGTVLQRVGTVTNSTGSDTVTFIDTADEPTRSQGELIYAADGGGPEDQNSMPPAFTTLAMNGDRLYASGLEDDPYGIRVSKLRLGGAVNFTDAGEMTVDSVGGPITALAPLDDKVIAFKRSRIYEMPADGPGNASQDSTPWPVPALVTSDVGAPYPPVIVEAAGTTVQGLVHVSDGRGVRLLDRSLRSVDIGGPVRGFDGLTFVGGLAPTNHEEVRLFTDSGTTLVLNTRFNQWSTFTPQVAVAAANWNRRPVYIGADGFAWAENTGSFLDDGQPYTMSVTLGWLPLASSLQGLSRVRQLFLLGTYYTSHNLRVEAAYDYRDSWYTLMDLDVTGALGIVPYGGGTSGSVGATGYGTGSYGGSDPIYQFRRDMPVQRMESLRLRISDQNATGRSFDLTELKLRVATESEKARLVTKKIR